MHPTITIAKRAALSAGKIVLRHFERLDKIAVNIKQHNDFVSEVDIQSEQDIIRNLRKIYPNHVIIAEESGLSTGGDDDCQWLIDPLDGTTNYLHGLPHFAISIAFRYKGKVESAVIYDPLRQEIFTASRGAGAQLNDRRIRVKVLAGLDNALLGTGFPFRYPQHRQAYLQMFDTLLSHCSDIRRTGAAALDLAYIASGRLDGFWEIGLKEWDIAAGALIVQEAGGLVSDFAGGNAFLKTGNVVAGSPKVFKGVLTAIQPHLTPQLNR